jgi:hypothetical protein
MSDEIGLGQKILNIDRRIIATITLVAIVFPLLFPIGLPITIAQVTQDTYDLIENLNEGDVVVFECSFDTGYQGSIGPGVTAVLTHLLQKQVKLVAYSLHIEGPITFSISWEQIPQGLKDQYEYGKDWVYLGFMTGGESAQIKAAEDLKSLFTYDHYGNRIEDLEMLNDINSFEDYDLIIGAWRGGEYGGHTMRIWSETFNEDLIQIGQMAAWPQNMLDAGLMVGYVRGTRGAAEYELILKRPGIGVAAMDAVSLAFSWLIISVIIGNIGFYMRQQEAEARR